VAEKQGHVYIYLNNVAYVNGFSN